MLKKTFLDLQNVINLLDQRYLNSNQHTYENHIREKHVN